MNQLPPRNLPDSPLFARPVRTIASGVLLGLLAAGGVGVVALVIYNVATAIGNR